MTIEVQPGLVFERLPDGGIQVDVAIIKKGPVEVLQMFMLSAGEWTALLGRLISSVPEPTDKGADGESMRQIRWVKAQKFHGVLCYEERPSFPED